MSKDRQFVVVSRSVSLFFQILFCGSSGLVWARLALKKQKLKDKLSYHSEWPILNYRVLSYDMCVRVREINLAGLAKRGIRWRPR
jgi:hypothetical protein